VIRTLVNASSELARAGLAAIVRADTRLALVHDDPDVLLEERDGPWEFGSVPAVALVDDPKEVWLQTIANGDERGAHAILGRDASSEEVVGAIVAVAAGLVAVQPRVLAVRSEATSGRDGAERLTSREIDVLGELARGVPNKTIAQRLGISEHTVKFHVGSIFAKLAVSSRTEAVTQGVRLGLIML